MDLRHDVRHAWQRLFGNPTFSATTLITLAIGTGATTALAVMRTLPILASSQTRPAPAVTRIADGVFLFATLPYGDVGLDGNAIAIVGRDGVLVFDSNGTPAASAAVLAGIRAVTPLPVRYVVNSHWHWDHWYGTETYRQAFPDVRVVAHEKTRMMMIGPALAFNQPGIERQLPAYLKAIEQKIAALEATNPSAPDLPTLRARLEEDTFFVHQKTNVHLVFPDTTYADRLTIDLGGRRVQLRHVDRAVTPGDTFLYLPDDRIVVTGDLLVNPIAFALSSYPTGWLRTLEQIDALDAETIVPGHGEPLHTKELLRAHMAVFRELLQRGAEARARGLDPDEAKAAILPQLHDLMIAMTHDDPQLNRDFQVYLVDWYLHRVYDELNGPLTDEIAPIPRS
ncbi:MAG TPA: MBL fold metallo-hydrolase [Vicinamibacterales bacterium]|jgi:glyoxylase-like metal-dependent hydrolase (beta-lactamase superfamily II)|nr:MBL fold metallo-hydrolase [Vicinamibacterales bacterium]